MAAGCIPAYCHNIIPDHPGYAGRVDKDRGRMIPVHDFIDAGREFLLPSKDHVPFLHIGGEAVPVHFRSAGQAAPDIPCIGSTADRSVDEVGRIGNRV